MDQMVPIKFVLMDLTKNQGSAYGRKSKPVNGLRASALEKNSTHTSIHS
jgi:hypothetical protein